jgi:transcriptional antiterminator Rof (Rho-off)
VARVRKWTSICQLDKSGKGTDPEGGGYPLLSEDHFLASPETVRATSEKYAISSMRAIFSCPEQTMQSRDLPADYQPIACSRHDQLESIATLRSRVTIRYLDDAGETLEVTDQVVDIYSRQGAEFLRTAAGLEIRLDRLESVDGISFRPDR